MKKIILLALLSVAFYVNGMAKGVVIYCSDCEYISVVADLPDSTDFYSEEYQGYIDIGYKYNQFWIFWVPVWNSNGQYCLTIKDKDVYFDITREELDALAKEYNIDLPSNPIPFWGKIGGKLVLGIVVLFGLWGTFGRKKDEDEEAKVEDTNQ
jgi:hypothetical protein